MTFLPLPVGEGWGEGHQAAPLFPFLLLNHQTVYKTVTPFDLVINIMTIR